MIARLRELGLRAWAGRIPARGGDLSANVPVPILARMTADCVLLALAFILGPLARYLWVDLVVGRDGPQVLYEAVAVQPDWAFFALAVLIHLCVFSLHGLYRSHRPVRRVEKILAITRASILSFLATGALVLWFGGTGILPRAGPILLIWPISWALLVAGRMWSDLWRYVIWVEQRDPSRLGARGASISAVPLPPRDRTVLVIGGAGYIGSALLPKLLGEGCRVRVLDLMLYGERPIEAALQHPRFELIQGDFRQIHLLVQAMRDADEVVHLGGLVGDPACACDEELSIDINLAATRAVAEVAKGEGIRRFVFASTCSVYGPGGGILDERSVTSPASLYARTKSVSERLLLDLADQDFRPIILRFATIYGVSGRMRFDLVVNLLTAKAVIDREITVFGGEQWRPFLHVDDAASAIRLALRRRLPRALNDLVFNVGSDAENYRIREVGELVRRHVPESKLVLIDKVQDARNYRVSFGKIRRVLGFEPRWTVADGIEQVIAAIERDGIRNYRQPLYSNAQFLTDGGTARLARPQRYGIQLLAERPVSV